MVKFVSYKGKKYIIITTTFQMDDVEAPVQIQINIDKVEPKYHLPLFKQSSFLLNRTLKLIKPQPKQDNISWWKRLFGSK